MTPRILFLGVGKMGLPMSRHLKTAGHTVQVHDLDPERMRLAHAAGLTLVSDPKEALQDADVVISSLPNDAALNSVAAWLAHLGHEKLIWIDTSTVSLQSSAHAAQQVAARGVMHLRVTVSGNNHMAEAAQLTVLASGPKDVFERMLPILKPWGPNQFYLGQGEQARLMKLVINLMIAQTSAMLSEAINLGQRGGLDWAQMWQVIGASAVGSPIVKAKAVQLSQHDYTPTFTVHQMLKDIRLMMQAGEQLNVPLPQLAMTQQLMRAAIAQGDGELDYAAIIRAMTRASGQNTPS